jgi:thioredoxin-related protein
LFLNNYFRFSRRLCGLLIVACACLLTAAHASPLPVVSDLEAAAKLAREQRVPVLVAFTLKRCPYCTIARRDYWAPMHGSEKWGGKAIMVEVEIDGAPALRDFDGKATSARDFARRFGIRSVPTVVVFDGLGVPAASPLVGLAAADFYALYLEQAVEAGLIKMRSSQ